MNEQHETTKHHKFGFLAKFLTKKVLGGLIAVFCVALIGVGIGSYLSSKNQTTQLSFADIGELATQAAYCTQVNVTEASRELFGVTIPFTQSKSIYSYDVVIKAGLDFGDIQWEVQENTITVRLPEIRILSSEIDLDSFQLYHESESIFRPITLEENNEAMVALKETAQESAVANGLLEEARANAETILTGFFAQEYDLETYSLEFTNL